MKLLAVITIITIIIIILTPSAKAQTCQTNSKVTNGLISTPNLDALNKLGTFIGNCVVNIPQAAIAPYRLPSYADLKSLYYTQAKLPYQQPPITVVGYPVNQTPADLNSTAIPGYLSTNDSTILVNGNLAINTPISSIATKTGVIFVEGSLSINTNVLYGTPGSSGLVFVVNGDINIDTKVTEIDAVLISGGTICTATENGGCPQDRFAAAISTTPLTIKGNLIALPSSNLTLTNQIKFKKNLFVNNIAAEQIVVQPKYLVLLRNIFTKTLSLQTDVNSGWNLTSCTSFCPISSTVTCGQPIYDNCGNTCGGLGTKCSVGNVCINSSCVVNNLAGTIYISPNPVCLSSAANCGTPVSSVNVSWQVPTSTTNDFLALYTSGASTDSPWISQLNTSCAGSPSQGSCPYNLPSFLPQGSYEMRYIQNGNYTQPLATTTFSVNN